MVPLPCPSCEGGFGLGPVNISNQLDAVPFSLIGKKDQFASPQYGNGVKSGVISSCFPKQTSDPNSTAFRSFPCVSLVYCLLDQDLQESLRC